MRITAVHSYYRSACVSGENLAVEEQVAALADAGHDIDLVARHSDALGRSRAYPLRAATRVLTGHDLDASGLPVAEGPEHLLLVHNLFPNFGWRWIQRWPGPVVTVVHNYRYLCANGLLLRDEQPCTLCVTGSMMPAVRNACYRDSRLATVPLAIGNRRPTERLAPLTRADVVVTQVDRARELFIEAGMPADRLAVVPGFTMMPAAEHATDCHTEHSTERHTERPAGWVFVGRPSSEKGLAALLRSWPATEPLDVIGAGEQVESFAALAPASVRFLATLPHDDVVARLPRYEGLVFPGVCWEGAHPMVVREAMANGVPVIAAAGSAAADVVTLHSGGIVYDPAQPTALADALRCTRTEGGSLREQARRTAESLFSRSRWQAQMDEVLRQAVRRRIGCEA